MFRHQKVFYHKFIILSTVMMQHVWFYIFNAMPYFVRSDIFALRQKLYCAHGTVVFYSRTQLPQAISLHRNITRRKANRTEKALSVMLSAFSGGRGWIRTIEGEASRFTVCPLWPLGNSPILNLRPVNAPKWSWWTDLNPRPADYKSAALPTELHQHF